MDVSVDLAVDLAGEQDALDAIVAGLSREQWLTPTPSPGWTVADQIGHLAYFDSAARLALTDPDAFQAHLEPDDAQPEHRSSCRRHPASTSR